MSLMPRFILIVLSLCFLACPAMARQRAGDLGGGEIRFKTEIVDSFEYVSAAELAVWFPNGYQYDALSGTLVFSRLDGVTVGMKADDDRVVVGQSIFYTGYQTLRRNSRILIPFSNVQTYLYPQVRLDPVDDSEASPLNNVVSGGDGGYQYNHSTDIDLTAPTPAVAPFSEPNLFNSFNPQDTNLAPSSVIVIDPGSQRIDPGWASSLTVNEPDLTLAIGEKLAALLRETQTFEIIMTRSRLNPSNLSQEERVGIANSSGASVYISFHAGNMHSPNASRAVVYCMNPMKQASASERAASLSLSGGLMPWQSAYKTKMQDSFRLAQLISKELKPFYGLRGIIQMDDNPRPGRLAALQGLTVPGALVDLGNLRHLPTAQHFASERIQMELAEKLERSLVDFLFERSGLTRAVGVR